MPAEPRSVGEAAGEKSAAEKSVRVAVATVLLVHEAQFRSGSVEISVDGRSVVTKPLDGPERTADRQWISIVASVPAGDRKIGVRLRSDREKIDLRASVIGRLDAGHIRRLGLDFDPTARSIALKWME